MTVLWVSGRCLKIDWTGGCLATVWRESLRCLDGVWRVSEVLIVFGGYLWDVRMVCGVSTCSLRKSQDCSSHDLSSYDRSTQDRVIKDRSSQQRSSQDRLSQDNSSEDR